MIEVILGDTVKHFVARAIWGPKFVHPDNYLLSSVECSSTHFLRHNKVYGIVKYLNLFSVNKNNKFKIWITGTIPCNVMDIFQTTRRQNPEEKNLSNHYHEELKCQK